MSLNYNLLKGEAPRSGLVGEWLLDDGLAVDTSGNGNDGTFRETTGIELVTNGGFDTDTDWVKDGGWTISGGAAHIVALPPPYVGISQNQPLNVGGCYRYSFDITNYVDGWVMFSLGDNDKGGPYNSLGTHSGYLCYYTPHPVTSNTINLFTWGLFEGSIDNVSVKEVSLLTPYKDRFNFADSSLNFNGTSDYINLGNPAELNFGTGSFSWCGWVNIETSLGWRTILRKIQDSPALSGYYIQYYDDGRFFAGVTDGTYTSTVDFFTNLADRYIFFALLVDRSFNKITFRVNNTAVEASINPLMGSVDNSFNCVLGATSEQVLSRFLDGNLSNVRAYNKALTDHEINNLYHETKQGKELDQSGMVLHYPFIDNSNDESGDFNDLNLFGTVPPIIGLNGRYAEDKGIEFDGVDQYGETADNIVVGDVLSVRLRFKEDSSYISGTRNIIGREAVSPVNTRFELDRLSGNLLALNIGDGVSSFQVTLIDDDIFDVFKDYIFVIDYANKTGGIYRNGLMIKEVEFPTLLVGETGNKISLATGHSFNYHNMIVDDFRVWNGLLTNSIIKAIYRKLPYKPTI